MTCDSCGTHSCYICGIQIKERPGGIKYYHFQGSGSTDPNAICQLYNDAAAKDRGNAMYNNMKLEQRCQQLIDMNDDVKIKKNIYKELQRMKVNITVPKEYAEKLCIIL